MGRKPLGTRPMTNAEKQVRKRKQTIARFAAYEAALQEIIEINSMDNLSTADRMSAMVSTAKKALVRGNK